jgi:hypothetical protein
MEPRQQVFPRGLRKIVKISEEVLQKFPKGFYSEFPRGSSRKPFPKGSKISNLVNRGVWILNGMALGAMSSTNYSLTV